MQTARLRRCPRAHGCQRRRACSRLAGRRQLVCRCSVIGIDLGTSNSAVAVIERGAPLVLPDAEGNLTMPSVVAYRENGQILVGTAAVLQAAANPLNTFSSVKRLMGRQFGEVCGDAAQMVFGITRAPALAPAPAPASASASASASVPAPAQDPNFRRGFSDGTVSSSVGGNQEGGEPQASGAVMLQCPALGRLLAPEEVAAALLTELAARAVRHMGKDITAAVVTVPAYFDERQRAATLLAAQMAGLPRVQLLQEPVAAAMAYGLGRREEADTILVLDLGGGTFDVSVLEGFEGILEVLATGGDARLGGDDFDRALVRWIRRQHAERGEDAEAAWSDGSGSTAGVTQRLLAAAEAAKVALSAAATAVVSPPAAAPLPLDAAQLEAITGELLARLGPPLDRLGRHTFMHWHDWPPAFGAESSESYSRRTSSAQPRDRFAPTPRRVTQIVLVGGATRMRAVRRAAEQLTGRPPSCCIDPELCVALGAAVHAGVLSGDIVDGLEVMDGSYSAGWHDRVSGFAI